MGDIVRRGTRDNPKFYGRYVDIDGRRKMRLLKGARTKAEAQPLLSKAELRVTQGKVGMEPLKKIPTCGVLMDASIASTPPIPTRFIHSRSLRMPSSVTLPFIQCHHTRGLATDGGARKPCTSASREAGTCLFGAANDGEATAQESTRSGKRRAAKTAVRFITGPRCAQDEASCTVKRRCLELIAFGLLCSVLRTLDYSW